MVIKNKKVATIDNVTVIELGNGDVKIGPVVDKDNEYVGVAFTNDIPREIGFNFNDKGKTTDEVGLDALLIFTKIESFAVVEEALNKAKETLKEILENKNE